jgi:hypothetical protein
MNWLDDTSSSESGSDVPDDWLTGFSGAQVVVDAPCAEEEMAEASEEDDEGEFLATTATVSSGVIRDIPGYYYDPITGNYYRDTSESRARGREQAVASSKPPPVVAQVPASLFRGLRDRERGQRSEVLRDALPSYLSAARPLAPGVGLKEVFGMYYEAQAEGAGRLSVAGTSSYGGCYSATYQVHQSHPHTQWQLGQQSISELDAAARVTWLETRSPYGVGSQFIFESVLGGGGAAGYLQVSYERDEESDDAGTREIFVTQALREGSMWCFALHPRMFTGGREDALLGLGGSKKAYLYDLNTQRITQTLNTNGSDVLHQQFSGDVLVSGLRDGRVRCHDIRLPSRDTGGVVFNTGSSVCWTHLLSGGQDLVACSMDGSALLLDLRRGERPKQRFLGHDNSHSMLRGCVDNRERFLFAGGEDGVVRAWCLRSARLLMANSSLLSLGAGTPQVLSWLPEGPSLVVGTKNGAFSMDVAGAVARAGT